MPLFLLKENPNKMHTDRGNLITIQVFWIMTYQQQIRI